MPRRPSIVNLRKFNMNLIIPVCKYAVTQKMQLLTLQNCHKRVVANIISIIQFDKRKLNKQRKFQR